MIRGTAERGILAKDHMSALNMVIIGSLCRENNFRVEKFRFRFFDEESCAFVKNKKKKRCVGGLKKKKSKNGEKKNEKRKKTKKKNLKNVEIVEFVKKQWCPPTESFSSPFSSLTFQSVSGDRNFVLLGFLAPRHGPMAASCAPPRVIFRIVATGFHPKHSIRHRNPERLS